MPDVDVSSMSRSRDDLDSVDEAIADYRRGRCVIVVDDESRENEGDLVIAAEFVTAETINFYLKYTIGVICVPITCERLDELRIPTMIDNNRARFSTAFTVSVDAHSRHGVTTGSSSGDRAKAVKVLIDPATQGDDIIMPGHMFPLRARRGGVLVRAGHTEAAVDLSQLAGLYPAAVLCEIKNPDGTMARLPELKRFAARHDLKVISIAHLIRYRTQTRHESESERSSRLSS